MLPGTGVSPDAAHLAPDELHRLPSGFRPQRPVPPFLSRLLLGSCRLYSDFLFDLENGKDCTPALPHAMCSSCTAPDSRPWDSAATQAPCGIIAIGVHRKQIRIVSETAFDGRTSPPAQHAGAGRT